MTLILIYLDFLNSNSKNFEYWIMSNVRKSTVSKKTNKDKDADKASTKKGPVGQVADSEAVTKQRKSSSQSKRS